MTEQKSLLEKTLTKRVSDLCGAIPEQFLLINITQQTLSVVTTDAVQTSYSISTSKYGSGNEEGSFKTPIGIHRIAEKIGDCSPARRIFKDRIDTGITWSSEMPDDDNLILSRILRLEGLEPGINRGPHIDSYERFIYIHGTNKEALIGTPISHGCICMKNNDIIELFNRIPEKTLVVIT